jgi:hypothetical protein
MEDGRAIRRMADYPADRKDRPLLLASHPPDGSAPSFSLAVATSEEQYRCEPAARPYRR